METLKWYGDKENWSGKLISHPLDPPEFDEPAIEKDQGAKARGVVEMMGGV